jgi:hypothetical protein
MPTSFDELCAMMDYRSLSHWLARPMSAAILAQLTPAQRKARTRAQQRLSKARLRPTKTFYAPSALAIPAGHEPPRAAHRDWLALDDPSRDILRP